MAMTRAIVCLGALALAGCFDFDALRQPRDGGAPGDDLASPADDLASDDLASAPLPDLAGGDGGGVVTPLPRLIAKAYYTDFSGTTYASTSGMTKTAFEVPTAGIVDGDLVIFVGSIDNGSSTLWPNPIAPGFTQLAQQFFGSDGQTFVVAYKIAAGEPVKYSGSYGPGGGSGSATIALIAVSGANKSMPINNSVVTTSSAAGMNPVNGSATSVITTSPNCALVLASGADWLGQNGTNNWALPPGFSSLAQLGDHGTLAWDWTSEQVSWAPQPVAGATGPINWAATGSPQNGQAWTVLIAVAP